MYLKLINLSEKMVTDEICLNIFALMTGITEGDIKIIRREHKILLRSPDKMILVGIKETGLIYTYDYNEGSSTDSDNHPEAYHLLVETQWRDQKVELPEDGQEVYIKEDCGINKAIYVIENAHNSWYQLDESAVNSSEISGWLPIENVVL